MPAMQLSQFVALLEEVRTMTALEREIVAWTYAKLQGRPHPVRVQFGNPNTVKREPDNARIRDALGAGIAVEGAELKRGEHIRHS